VYEANKGGHPVPTREGFGFICPNPEFAKLRMVPVECCAQLWHETKGGELEHEAHL